jgi:antitoxin VapB
MGEQRLAKLFRNGASQAVRLPAEFRFDGEEVFVSRDGLTGDVILSAQPAAYHWAALFDLLRELDVPDDFLAERPMNAPPRPRDVFEED